MTKDTMLSPRIHIHVPERKPRNEARVKTDKECRGIHSIRRRRVGYVHMFMCTHVFFLPVDS